MSPGELVVVALAGGAAGFINTVAGSGTLVTFPTLLAFGVPPVTANVSNNVGLVPGSVSGALGMRPELAGQQRRVRRLASASLVGGLVGAVLLLVLPAAAFAAIVPVLVGLGILLVAFQPMINTWLAGRRESQGRHAPGETRPDAWWVWPMTALVGVYGGYFGAAQGIILMGALGLGLDETLHRQNALKNVLASVVNAVAAVVFILVAHVDWVIAALIAVGSILGALLAARVGRRLPPALLRAVIVVIGVTALVVFLVRS